MTPAPFYKVRRVQVEPMNSQLKAPGTKRLKLVYDARLLKFALSSNCWRFKKAPNNWFGRVTGVMFRIPGLAEDAYMVLKQQFKLSDVTILFLVLAVPVTVGMLCIFIVDMYIVSNEKKVSAERRMREAGAYTRPLFGST